MKVIAKMTTKSKFLLNGRHQDKESEIICKYDNLLNLLRLRNSDVELIPTS